MSICAVILTLSNLLAQNTNNRVNKITNVVPLKENKKIENEDKVLENQNIDVSSPESKKNDEIFQHNLKSSNAKKGLTEEQQKERLQQQEIKIENEKQTFTNARQENIISKQTSISSETPIDWEANTIAVKVTDAVENNTINVEKKPQKIKISENYNQRLIKEETQPVAIESNKISSFKIKYLEEEAIQIQKIINENATNPDFDKKMFEEKLEKIRVLLKQ